MKFEIYPQIFEKNWNINFTKIRAMGAAFFHGGARADRQAYMTKLTVAFRNCANAPKNKRKLPTTTCDNVTFSYLM
jgi:hypothetical protein